MKEINKMTPEELRIACAEKCGWSIISDKLEGYAPFDQGFFGVLEIPNYQYDRNALQELILAVMQESMEVCEDFIMHIIDSLKLDAMLFSSALEGNSCNGNVPSVILSLMTADPLAIMRAFLEVMEEN